MYVEGGGACWPPEVWVCVSVCVCVCMCVSLCVCVDLYVCVWTYVVNECVYSMYRCISMSSHLTSDLCKPLPLILVDQSHTSMLDYFIQFMENEKALHLVQFWLSVEAFKTTPPSSCVSVRHEGVCSAECDAVNSVRCGRCEAISCADDSSVRSGECDPVTGVNYEAVRGVKCDGVTDGPATMATRGVDQCTEAL